MNCPICNCLMDFFFEKKFKKFNLGTVKYIKCPICKFVVSKSHLEMDNNKWKELNKNYHSYHTTNFTSDDLNWTIRLNYQSNIITELYNCGILKNGTWLDYGCGDGKLSNYINKLCNIKMLNFDIEPCSKDIEYINKQQLECQKYDLVITTSVFEHLRSREELNYINNLVSTDGVLGIHTLISEEVPKDPNWFYLIDVHCMFHTNEGMSRLFNDWGYKFSLYNVESRLWLLFKKSPPDINVLDKLNKNNKKYHYKFGFMDYWK